MARFQGPPGINGGTSGGIGGGDGRVVGDVADRRRAPDAEAVGDGLARPVTGAARPGAFSKIGRSPEMAGVVLGSCLKQGS